MSSALKRSNCFRSILKRGYLFILGKLADPVAQSGPSIRFTSRQLLKMKRVPRK